MLFANKKQSKDAMKNANIKDIINIMFKKMTKLVLGLFAKKDVSGHYILES